MQGVHLRKYGVQATIDFELYEVDGVNLRTDWTPAQADCEIMKDGGASTMCTNTATDEGSTYSIVITSTEAQAARLVIKVVDAATKVFLDKVIIVETYGNASAQHAFDLDTASTAQTGDSYAIVNNGTYGNAQLVRSTTPANTLSVDASGDVSTDSTSRTASKADVSGLATTTELDKVPKSDGAVSWNVTALAAVQSEANDALVANNLDHLCKTATAGADMTTEVADNTILSRVLAAGDTSAFTPATDGLQPIRDHIGDGTNLTEAGGDGDHLSGLPNQTMDITGNISTVTNVSNDVGITQAGADKVWGTAARTLTANTNLNDPTAAEVATAVWATAVSDLAAVPGATASADDALSWIYMLCRNKVVTDASGSPSVIELYNDAGTLIADADVSDAASVFTRAKWLDD